MTQADGTAKQTENTAPPLMLLPIVPPLIGIGVWVFVLALLMIAAYLVPTITAIGLAAISACAVSAWLLWQHPEAGLVVLIFMVAGFIPADLIDLRLPIGGLDLRDLCLLGMIGMLGLRQMVRARPILVWPAVSVPLLGFMTLALCSAVYALRYQGVETHWVFNELRTLTYYLIFFIVVWGIERTSQLKFLLAGLVAFANLANTLVITQQFFGRSSPLLAAMAGTNWYIRQQGEQADAFGTVRIIPPGQVMLFMVMVISFSFMVSSRVTPRLRRFFALEFMFLNAGMILTYTRGQWIASVIALGFSTLFLAPPDKARLLRQVLAAGLVVLFIFGVFGSAFEQQFETSAFAEAVTERASSIFTPQQTLDSASLQWRLFEDEEAIKSIMQHPIMGVGLGNTYRDITLLQGEARGWWGTLASGSYGRFTRYVHNSYLYITAKMGLTGILALGWFFMSFLWQGWRIYKALPDSHAKRLVLVIIASFIAVLPWSITQAHFMQVESTTAIGLMAGLVATMYQMEQRRKAAHAALPRRAE